MKHTIKRLLALALSTAMVCSLMSLPALAAGAKTDGIWNYTVSEDGTAAIVGAKDDYKSQSVVLIPAQLGGAAVSQVGSGSGAVLTNYRGGGYILVPREVTAIADRAFYDCNPVTGWSIFSTTSTAGNSFNGCSGEHYGDDDLTQTFTVSASAGGAILPNGTYGLPAGLTAGGYTADFTITADIGYQIAALTVDDAPVEAAAGQNSYTLSYTFGRSSSAISVAFEADPDDERTPDVSGEYEAPAVVDGAVADGVELPSDVYAYIPDLSTDKYENSIGVSTGTYYAVDGQLYEMVFISQSDPKCQSKAEAINYLFNEQGLVYGQDYDLLRVYNYEEDYANGPRPDDFDFHCIYAYKAMGSKDAAGLTSNSQYEGAYRNDNSLAVKGDVGTIFAQAGVDTTITDLLSYCHTIPYGPSEAANFYGLGSSILADGQSDESASTVVDDSNGRLTLINPNVLGSENAVFAVAKGLVDIQGGNFFGASSGGHGMYVGKGGQILLNVNDDLVAADGTVNRDIDSLRETALQDRPAMDLGGAKRATEAEKAAQGNTPASVIGTFEDHPDDVTVISTADETGTALTTDTGGGLIVANRVSATTFGRGCAGVYSIGANESWVYVMNSALHSNADAALCSASGGYVFAFNTELEGISGLKTRANGSAEDAESGIEVYNSQVTVSFDPDEYDFYDMARAGDTWPEESSIWDNSFGPEGKLVNSPLLNLFINKTNATWGQDLTTEMSYWYQDKNTAPQTGEVVAAILGVSSGTKVSVDSVQFVNQNYADYADQGAVNYLVAATNGADMTVEFRNENSQTKWDLTGKNDGTTELTGDILATAFATSTEPGTLDQPASADVTFINSEWTGSVCGYGKNVSLHFDADSTWTIPAGTELFSVGDLTAASLDSITAQAPVTIQVFGSLTVGGQAVTEDVTVGNVTYKVHPVSMYFSDLGDMAWAAAAVDELAACEVLPMTGSYAPLDTATLADLVTTLYAASDDGETGASYEQAAQWAAEKGMVLTGGADDALTRGAAMELLYAAFGALNITADPVEGDPLAVYVDGNGSEALPVLVGMGIVKGTSPTTLDLGAALTRGEMAVLLVRTLEHVPSGGMMPPPGMGPGGMPGGPGGDGGNPPPPPN